MDNNPYVALENLKLIVMHSDLQLWAWGSVFIAGVALVIFMISELKLILWLGVTAVLMSAHFFIKLSSVSKALANNGIFL